jgi:hypothetical protein
MAQCSEHDEACYLLTDILMCCTNDRGYVPLHFKCYQEIKFSNSDDKKKSKVWKSSSIVDNNV